MKKDAAFADGEEGGCVPGSMHAIQQVPSDDGVKATSVAGWG